VKVSARELSSPDERRIPAACAVYLAAAEIKYEQFELPGAQQALETCLQLARQAGWAHVLWQAYVLLSQVTLASGDYSGAREALQLAAEAVQRYKIPYIQRLFSAHRAGLELALGELGRVERWAAAQPNGTPEDSLQEFEALILARFLLACQQSAGALEVLDRLLPPAETVGRIRIVIEAQALRAHALEAQGDLVAAQSASQRARALAEPEGFVRSLVDVPGKDRLALHEASEAKLIQTPSNPFMPETLPAKETLVEPLSKRELEVLRLICAGLSNPEIAGRLFLSVNTLRAHTSNIYGKLGVHSRLQAASKARELGLVKD
jgi:LuxR family maltose regulon positive regulatory protein